MLQESVDQAVLKNKSPARPYTIGVSNPTSSMTQFRRFRETVWKRSTEIESSAFGHVAKTPEGAATDSLVTDGAAASQNGSPSRTAGRSAKRGYLREYRLWLRPFYGRLLIVLCLALASAGLSLILPAATMYIIDVVVPSGEIARLHQLGMMLVGVILLHQGLDWLRNWRQVVLNHQVLVRIRRRLHRHLLHLPLHRLSDMKTGGISSRLSGDVDSVTGLIQEAFISPGVSAAKVLMTLTILFWINWKLSIAATLLLPGVVLLNVLYLNRVRPIYRAMRRDRAEIDARIVETFGGIRVVRGFRGERREARGFAVNHHTVIRKRLLAYFYECFVWSGWGLLIPITALVVVWYGSALVLAGEATVGGLIAFQMYLMMLMAPVSAIVRSYGELQQALAAMERISDVLAEPIDKPDRPHATPAPVEVREIEFERVSFGYRPDAPVLRDVSLRVAGSSTVALVGSSGSGKTTLTNLVARFYDPDTGAIRLNGTDLRDLHLRSYRRLLGIVQQDTFLFDGTIAENIAYARAAAPREEIITAARRANADAFIREFPNGYDTLVGERGVRLSGGQAQRVSIARALLADPRILILDEATSNLDSESEHLIQEALATLLAGRTTFVIAHRLSTITHADLIVVMQGGRVIETGAHASLLESGGLYAEMVARQQQGILGEAELS